MAAFQVQGLSKVISMLPLLAASVFSHNLYKALLGEYCVLSTLSVCDTAHFYENISLTYVDGTLSVMK